jgi:putative endonuclease
MPNLRRIKLGQAGEQIAADHLVRRGFTIIERNYRTRYGELDIIVSDGRTLVFCEVKTRLASRDGRDPLESVDRRKQVQLRRMAARWLVERPDRPRVADLRFDAIGITLDQEGRLLRLDHLEAAF